MSTLRVNTIQNALGNGDPSISGAAKAWVNFNGSGTVAIRASFNVSSITDNGVGDYTVNFSNALVDANYSVASMGRNTSNQEMTTLHNSVLPTASAVRIRSQSLSTYGDNEYMYATIFR
jgi:hypothetical protein